MSGPPLTKADFLRRAWLIEKVIRYINTLPHDDPVERAAQDFLASKLSIQALAWHERAKKEG